MGHAIAKSYRVAITKEKTKLDAGFFIEILVSDCDSDVMKTVVIRQQLDGIDITLVEIRGENSTGHVSRNRVVQTVTEQDELVESQAEIDTELATEEEQQDSGDIVIPELVSPEQPAESDDELKSLIRAMGEDELKQLAIESGVTPEDLLAFASE